MRKRWHLVAIGLCAAAALVVAATLWQSTPAFRPEQVVPPRGPITQFPIKPVRDVGDAVNPSELVLGVTVGDEARAYPINMLTGPDREILNDALGGKPIAATW